MQKRWVVFLNVFVLLVVAAFLVLISFNFLIDEEVVVEECVDVNKVASFVYDTCYDAYSKTIFVTVERASDSYNLKALDFYFSDGEQQVYSVSDVPNVGEGRAYKFSAEKNPKSLNVKMNIVKDFSAPVCSEPRVLFVKYCPSRINEESIEGDISPFPEVDPNDFVEVQSPGDIKSDIFQQSLVEKERIWESTCKSDWECGDWESCVDGVERRSCVDMNNCYVPTRSPETVRYCDGTCIEDWECEWSSCSGGFTTPSCRDLNNCGT
ncbi:MAG: hypothetical protein MI922_25700, partial [Bacteroidales bacterium]|nr:hypothetical protein [Bacteroidales bacterium]